MKRLFFCLLILLYTSMAKAGLAWSGIAVTPEAIPRLTSDLEFLDQTFWNAPKDQSVYLDKAWHGIHYLLTGSSGPTNGLASKVIFGGESFGPEQGYGQAQLLTPVEVKAIAKLLSSISPEELSSRFIPSAMEKADIYPSIIWVRDGSQSLNYLLSFYKSLVKFYQRAAERGYAVILAVN